MDDVELALLIILDEELSEEEREREPEAELFKQRSKEGCFELLVLRHLNTNECKFRQYFRLTPVLFDYVLNFIRSDITAKPTNRVPTPISAEQKLAIFLRFLATGESFRSLSFQYRVSHSWISYIIKQVASSIVKRMIEILPQPTEDFLKNTSQKFMSMWNFPNCVGAIDGKHIRIKAPSNSGSLFFNYKEYYSIVLLAIVDAECKFIAVDVGSYGREGDAANTTSSKDSNNCNNSHTNGCAGGVGSASGASNSNSSSSNPNGNGTRSCRTPDSPESTRAVAPRSPMSPQLHLSTLAPPPPRPNRNASTSPVVNGATTTTTPPPLPTPPTQAALAAAAAAATAAAVHAEQTRLLSKIRKFLGSLVQLAQEVHPEVSDRVRALVLSLVSGSISIDDFRQTLQDAINLPLRPYVIPLLKNNISLLQREIAELARATNQTPLQYVTTNENVVMEFSPHGPSAEYSDMFVHMDAVQAAAAVAQAAVSNAGSTTSLVFKRRASDTLMEHHNGVQDWNDYMAAYPPSKRALHSHTAHLNAAPTDGRLAFAAQPTIFDYSTATSGSASVVTQSESTFNSLMEKASHREERDLRVNTGSDTGAQRHAPRSSHTSASGGSGSVGNSNASLGGEEEWKNIHTMLNCISAMVDKTKRAITILQQRGVEPQQPNYGELTSASLVEIRRQTEEKVAEFKRNAEDAVNQVKRQAVIEIQRAVVAAETRASEVMTQERLRMEKFFVEMTRHSGGVHNASAAAASVVTAAVVTERELDNKSPSITAGQNACWNCGRKATETCSGCNLARYCGAFCQHKDWEHHHQICGTTRSTDLSAKHTTSQGIPLSASMRGSISRSPPNQSQTTAQVAQPQNSGGGGVAPPSSLVANGVGSK